MVNDPAKRGFARHPELAVEAGRKGGQNSGGNFKNDSQRASEAGKKGGKNSRGDGRLESPIDD